MIKAFLQFASFEQRINVNSISSSMNQGNRSAEKSSLKNITCHEIDKRQFHDKGLSTFSQVQKMLTQKDFFFFSARKRNTF